MSHSLEASTAIHTLEHLPVGVLLVEDGRISWLNQKLQQTVSAHSTQLIGLQQDQVRKTDLAALFDDSDRLEIRDEQGNPHWFTRFRHELKEKSSTAFYFTEITQVVKQEKHCATLIAQMRQLETSDPLTGLLNKKGILHQLETQVSLSRRYAHPLSLLRLTLYAIDQTQDSQINELMKTLGLSIKGHMRWTDQIGYLSDNSFLIILPETRLIDATQLIDKLVYDRATLQPSSDWSIRFDVASWCKGDDTQKLLERLQ